MHPRCFVDLTLERHASPLAAAAVLRVLHGAFRQQPGQYALALPDYPRAFPRLRIFAESRDALDTLVGSTEAHPTLAEHARYSYPRTVPDDFAGPWTSFRRYRIPTRKAERKPDGSLRLRRIQSADDARLPYFPLRSESNGHTWRLYVEARPADAGGEASPDAYGLATATRPFGLPTLP